MAEREEGGKEISMPLSLLVLPFLFAVGLISIPFNSIYRQIARRRRKTFETQMRSKQRLIEWNKFYEAFEAGEGTVIAERYSFKKVRSWWTPDPVYSLSPFPIPEWLGTLQAKKYNQFSDWCHSQYTSPTTGRALLISAPSKEQGKQSFDLWQKHRNDANKAWIEMVPPEVLPRPSRHASNHVT